MALETQGKLHEVFETQQITEKFKKREFVVEIDDNGYLQHVKFQLNQDKCSLIDNYSVGENIKVAFNLSGRQYTSKTGEKGYITNVVAWKLDKLGASNAAAAPIANNQSESPSFPINASAGEDDSLPF